MEEGAGEGEESMQTLKWVCYLWKEKGKEEVSDCQAFLGKADERGTSQSPPQEGTPQFLGWVFLCAPDELAGWEQHTTNTGLAQLWWKMQGGQLSAQTVMPLQ